MVQVEQSMIMRSMVEGATDRFLKIFYLPCAIIAAVSIVATLVVGTDGSTSKESRSAGISSAADRQVFLQRRREVDCIIIGGNTARHEPYNRTPVPLVVVSRSLVNPVQGNHRALLWNCSPVQAVEKAREQFGPSILIEGGIALINDLIEHKILERIELSVTPATGGQNIIDWKELLAKFENCQSREVDGTTFYSAWN